MTTDIKTLKQAKAIIRSKASVFVAIQGVPDQCIQVVKADVLDMIATKEHKGQTHIEDYYGNHITWHFFPEHMNGNGGLYIDGGF